MGTLTKKALKGKIAELDQAIAQYQKKRDALEYTLLEFFPNEGKKQTPKKPSDRAERGIHPKMVRKILQSHPEGLTTNEIVERLKQEENHGITLQTLSSVLNRDKEETIIKIEKSGRGYKYGLKGQVARPLLEAVNNG